MLLEESSWVQRDGNTSRSPATGPTHSCGEEGGSRQDAASRPWLPVQGGRKRLGNIPSGLLRASAKALLSEAAALPPVLLRCPLCDPGGCKGVPGPPSQGATTGWLRTTDMDFLTVVGARSPSSRCPRSRAPSAASRSRAPQPLPSVCGCANPRLLAVAVFPGGRVQIALFLQRHEPLDQRPNQPCVTSP